MNTFTLLLTIACSCGEKDSDSAQDTSATIDSAEDTAESEQPEDTAESEDTAE
jgi:hypothetical protein